ncbi:MAG: hypothetical protein HY595_02685 [Candidatus Omnitrophica bacterium]|nr:hypothetical protein [Candidatus Omnitrophota bacterium]
MARQTNFGQLVLVLVVIAGVGAFAVWRVRLQALDREINAKKTALKNLHVSEQLPPNPQVVEYLKQRTKALEAKYEAALARLAPPLQLGDQQTDTQLLFQERSHAAQRTLERLATARNMTAPTQLGFPKDLPPPEAVPRFLVQVGLIEQAAEAVMAVPGVSRVESFKVEDPQPVVVTSELDVFLTQLPIRIRLSCPLETLTKILTALDRADPLMDVQAVRVTTTLTESGEEAEDVVVELVVARYFVTAPKLPTATEEEPTEKKKLGARS